MQKTGQLLKFKVSIYTGLVPGRRSHLRADPGTDEELGSVPEMTVEEARQAIDAAGIAFKSWGKTTAKERHDILVKFFNLMQQNAEDLARIIVSPATRVSVHRRISLATSLLRPSRTENHSWKRKYASYDSSHIEPSIDLSV